MTPERSLVAWVPDRGDVIWIDHNPQAGRERKDHHPFVVLSTAAFHRTMGLVVGCAMTSAAYNRGAVAHPGLNPHHRLWPWGSSRIFAGRRTPQRFQGIGRDR